MISTQNADIVSDLGAIVYHLDVLDNNLALKLLAYWAAVDVVELPAKALDATWERNKLPLTLAMIGAMVRV